MVGLGISTSINRKFLIKRATLQGINISHLGNRISSSSNMPYQIYQGGYVSVPWRASLSPLGFFLSLGSFFHQVAACAFTNSTPSRARVASRWTSQRLIRTRCPVGKLSIASRHRKNHMSFRVNTIKMVDFPASYVSWWERMPKKNQHVLSKKQETFDRNWRKTPLVCWDLCYVGGIDLVFLKLHKKKLNKKIATSLHFDSTYSAFIHLVNPKKVVITSKDVLFQMQKKKTKTHQLLFCFSPNHFLKCSPTWVI